jgi:hypothetical protein
MKFFSSSSSIREQNERLRALLLEAIGFVKVRGCYYYNHEMRGPGADLVNRVNQELESEHDRAKST